MQFNFEAFVEWDNSPFILFDNKGSITYLNHSAEILFGYVTQKELYDIALAYATNSFGYATTTMTLLYGSYKFYSITVGYEDEHHISLRLYHTPQEKSLFKIEKSKLIHTNINILLEAHLSLFRVQNNAKIRLLVDQDLPSFRLNQNNFSKLLRKVLHSFRSSDSIEISLTLLIGQHILIESKKVAIIQLDMHANGRYHDHDTSIEQLATESHIKPILLEHGIKLEIPLIQE